MKGLYVYVYHSYTVNQTPNSFLPFTQKKASNRVTFTPGGKPLPIYLFTYLFINFTILHQVII
ncbi:hypothetical protein D8Z77_01725 [Brevibacillus laterosporus]|nr:hypothetical protein D8Z77_01725 [Brevibacillus laterosporus]